MKTYCRKILRAGSLFLFAGCNALILSGDVAAQPGKVRPAAPKSTKVDPKQPEPSKKNVTWNASYTVTIKGHGEQKGELQGEPDIKWWVDRTFVGKMSLMGPTQLRSGDNKVVPGWESYENYGAKANPPTVKVTIKDRLEKFLEGPGEIGTHENRTDITVWEGDPLVTGGAEDLTALAINPEKRTYWVVLAVFLRSPKKDFRMARYSVINRSAEGYGGKPTDEVSKPIEDMISLADIPMPNGDHLMRGRNMLTIIFPNAVTREHPDSPLPASYPYLIDFPKTCFKPTEPFFQGIEDTKTKVDICVEFSFFKAPQ